MFRTLLASTAIASALGFAALAEDTASDPLVQAPAADAPATMAPAETAQDPAATGMMSAPDAVLTPVATADISADKLIGADIRTTAGETVASVDDLVMSADGKIESVVAEFGGFLGFGSNKALLAPDEIDVLQDASGTYVVQTALTPEAFEGRPDYVPAQ